MRAVGKNPALAGIAGVKVRQGDPFRLGARRGLRRDRRRSWPSCWYESGHEWDFKAHLPLFAAAILGGIGNVPGMMLAGLVVGLTEAIAVAVIGAEWRAAVAFRGSRCRAVIRPQGLFGRRNERRADRLRGLLPDRRR